LIGVGQAFREVNPACRLFAVEPDESCTIVCGETGRHAIEGISDGFVPDLYTRHESMVDGVISVPSVDGVSKMRRLARDNGFFVGPSSGANLLAAHEVRATNPDLSTVVTMFCDRGEKYLSEYFPADAQPPPQEGSDRGAHLTLYKNADRN